MNRFDGLLEVNKEVTVYVESNLKLMIEVYKYANGLSNSITNDIFLKRNIEYNLRSYRELASYSSKLLSRYGLESVNYKASQLWQNVPMEIKNSASLEIFKLKMKS